ncbi:unnamed protein product [Xylocopa violacea]|uniref:RRM domain-containing protein n=1 Tax=Xylocopa violacea TaxID=135666 RepID=A0ABP1P7X0_XYLVO
MDYDRYYSKNDNSYLIHFPNNKGLSLTEIDKIFSSYGKVLSIDNRGQSHGLCFVRYERLEAVKRCIDALQNHSFIKILKHKLKVNAKINTKRTTSLYTSKNNTMDQATFNNDANDVETNSLSDISSINSLITVSDQKSATKRIRSLKDCLENKGLVHTDQQNKMYNFKTSSPTTKSVQAQQVIVANIHPSLSIHYILHLFEKYNPIAVSLMMTIPKSGIRYCHVYYKTYEEAYATMKEFDRYYLQGKSLIVLTSLKLMEI